MWRGSEGVGDGVPSECWDGKGSIAWVNGEDGGGILGSGGESWECAGGSSLRADLEGESSLSSTANGYS